MRKIIILVAALLITGIHCFAQDAAYTKSGDQYVASYYTPLLWGVNGFRTVEEENRIMEQTLAERRRQIELENMTPEERANMKNRHLVKQEIKNDALAAKKEKAEARKKQQAAKKDSVAAKKPEPKKK